MIDWREVMFEQVFTFNEWKSGVTKSWAVERATKWLEQQQRSPIWFPVQEPAVNFIRQNNGVERHRLERMTKQVIQQKPILIFNDPNDKSTLMLDGSHRYVRAFDFGMSAIQAFVIEEQELTQFEVSMPPALRHMMLTGFSGIG